MEPIDKIVKEKFSFEIMNGHLCMKMKNDNFSIETPMSQNGSFHDFHHLHQFDAKRSTSNFGFGVEKEIDLGFFDVLPCDFVSSKRDLTDYEYTLLVNGGGHEFFIDNFVNTEDYLLNETDSMEMMMERCQGNIAKKMQEIKPIILENFSNNVLCMTDNHDYHQKTNVEKIRTKPLSCSTIAKKPWKFNIKKNLAKGQWTIEEDRILIQIVELKGVTKWSDIAKMLPGRIGKQCRERWHNHLRPNIKKDTWSNEEDKILIQAHKEIGNKWAEISKRLQGRTDNSIKNHWNATKRRQYSKRKCRSKYPRGSLLQEYIKSLNLDSNIGGCKKNCENTMMAFNALNLENWKYEQPRNMFNQEIQEFDFDEKIFEEEFITDSFLDEILCTPFDDHKRFRMDVIPLFDFETKKELDLVEMISLSKK